MDLETNLDLERYNHYFERDFRGGDTPESATEYFFKWASIRYLPDEIIPTLKFARNCAEILKRDLGAAGPRSMEVYVSHDTWVMALMYHWFGMGPPPDWVRFMDGFVAQIKEPMLNAYTRDTVTRTHRPHWWSP